MWEDCAPVRQLGNHRKRTSKAKSLIKSKAHAVRRARAHAQLRLAQSHTRPFFRHNTRAGTCAVTRPREDAWKRETKAPRGERAETKKPENFRASRSLTLRIEWNRDGGVWCADSPGFRLDTNVAALLPVYAPIKRPWLVIGFFLIISKREITEYKCYLHLDSKTPPPKKKLVRVFFLHINYGTEFSNRKW